MPSQITITLVVTLKFFWKRSKFGFKPAAPPPQSNNNVSSSGSDGGTVVRRETDALLRIVDLAGSERRRDTDDPGCPRDGRVRQVG